VTAVSRESRTLIALFLPALLGILVVGWLSFGDRQLLEQGDFAANALMIDQAKSAPLTYGHYSRWRWRHPGPAHWQYLALWEIALHDSGRIPSPAVSHVLGNLALQFGWLAAAIGLLASWRKTHRAWFAALALPLVGGYLALQRFGSWTLWPPDLLAGPYLLLVVSCASVAAGRLRQIPWMVLAASMLVHLHVTEVLFAGAPVFVTACFVIGDWRRGEIDPAERAALPRAAAIAGLILVLFATPLVVDLVSPDSNLLSILKGAPGGRNPPVQAIIHLLMITTLDPEGHASADVSPGPLLIWAVIAVSLWGMTRREPTLLYRRFGVLCAVILVLAAGWTWRQAGGLMAFNNSFLYGLMAALLGFWLLAATRFLPPPKGAVAHGLLVAASVAVTVAAVSATVDPQGDPATEAAHPRLLAFHQTSRDPLQPVLLLFPHDEWHHALEVALVLTREGRQALVHPWWRFMFTERHASPHVDGGPAHDDVEIWSLEPFSIDEPDATPELYGGWQWVRGSHRLGAEGNWALSGQEASFAYHRVGWLRTDESLRQGEPLEWIVQPEPATGPVEIQLRYRADPEEIPSPAASGLTLFWNGRKVKRLAGEASGVARFEVSPETWNERPTALLRLEWEPDSEDADALRLLELRSGPG